MKNILCIIASVLAGTLVIGGTDDWPYWGRNTTRNMVSNETGLPDSFDPGQLKGKTEEIDPATTKNVLWVAKVGSQTYGNPTVAGGRVFVGTNNHSPRDPKLAGDRSVVMCFSEKTGEFLWHLPVPKLGSGKVNDWEYLGICSSPWVEGDRVYVLTNRCEVVCLDVHGMANGNDGPFTDEVKYLTVQGQPPPTLGPKDGDIIWRFDMREELGVFPHNATGNSVLILGDKVYATTSNGVDWGHLTIPSPKAPALVVLDRKTGKYLGEEVAGISARTFHGNWSSPTYGKTGNQEMVFFGAGDGFCYAFDPEPRPEQDGVRPLKEIWRFDCNPHHYRFAKDGKPLKYATAASREEKGQGPSEVIATPVFYKNRVYVAIGQDPEHGEGAGHLVCIDASKTGDISKTGLIWGYDKIKRSMSTVSIVNGLLYVADFSGYVHCLDAETGKPQWVYDCQSHIWGSTLVADGKVYVGTEDGDVIILGADKTLKVIKRINTRAPVYSSPIVANGTLYVATQTHLYAIVKKD